MKLLEAVELTKVYGAKRRLRNQPFSEQAPAVNGVSLELRQNETLGLVGESGCGKSTLARMLLRLEAPTSGRIRYRDMDITNWNFNRMREIRSRMQIVFQNSFSSFNPAFDVSRILAEPLRNSGIRSRDEQRRLSAEALESVGLSEACLVRRPAELSGGQQQRVGIARAIVLRPEILILDEPFSSLDFSLRRQTMHLLSELKQQLRLSYLFITHDLSIIEHFCDRVAVMRQGEILERQAGVELQTKARHPYTRMLLDAIPAQHPRQRKIGHVLTENCTRTE
ncbi:dipeptide/oligopeptide/nickel ABC transporter ATP-binding protein [Saccharibacillus sp. O23]|uniref:ABC transporter ATP-binding protein n=1 Tax=Saccharibacillus sp. O23 TaxID=2009338 RepID=UPI000B4E1D0C|nr:ABC transporter ATP-binding protein [Saccharibacillus sp. O23]OWR30019.1 dipeptide/oligopeptide/nickel ABC transporter ATP-binding protein [Saccharibacillus sp. O23]